MLVNGWSNSKKEPGNIKDLDKTNDPQLCMVCAKRRDPLATMDYHLNEHEEKKCLDLLANLAGRHIIHVNAYEADGLTRSGMGRFIEAAANERLMSHEAYATHNGELASNS